MSEVKRVSLTTISSSAAATKDDGSRISSLFGDATSADSATFASPATIDKKSKKKLTMRFELELFSPTDDKFPEFNYVNLVQMEKVSCKFSSFPSFILSFPQKMHEFLGGVEGEVASDTDAFAAVFFCPFLVALFIYPSIHSIYPESLLQ